MIGERVQCPLCHKSIEIVIRGTMPRGWYGHWDGTAMHRVCSRACLDIMRGAELDDELPAVIRELLNLA